jgi:hypothetical protein
MFWLICAAVDTIGDYKVAYPTQPAPTIDHQPNLSKNNIVYPKDVKVVTERPFDIDALLANIMLGIECFLIGVAVLILLVLLLRCVVSHEWWLARTQSKQRYPLALAKQKELRAQRRHRKSE